MMKTYLKKAFQLSDSGAKGLVKSIWSFFLYYVSFVPPMICVFLFADRLLHAVALLKKNGFLKMNQDYDLVLTDSGRAIASCIYEKHCYFKDRLISAGVSPETAEIEACRLEHCVSEESFHKLRKTYGY